MSISLTAPAAQIARNSNSIERSIGVIPDFHHVPPNSAVALESYMHLYLESSALTESTFKDSIEYSAH